MIKKSRYARTAIYMLVALPFLCSLILNLPKEIQLALFLLSVALLRALLFNIFSVLSNEENYLSWQDGIWTFCTQELIIKGKQRKQSFSLGLVLFLSIEDPAGNYFFLWLFPDSPSDDSSGGQEEHQKDWRHLHSCFNLSN